MDKLAAIQSAILELEKEAVFGSVLAAGARLGSRFLSKTKPVLTGAGSAAASAGRGLSTVARPFNSLKATAATIAFPMAYKGRGATHGIPGLT